MDLRKIDLRTKSRGVGATSEAVTTELSEAQMSSVCGGKGKASPVLMKACATGVHLREVTITV
jgi:type VI protein secretion system component Hcp